jgi:hypothetical protein
VGIFQREAMVKFQIHKALVSLAVNMNIHMDGLFVVLNDNSRTNDEKG